MLIPRDEHPGVRGVSHYASGLFIASRGEMMPNRKLSALEIVAAVSLHNSIRKRLDKMSAGDPELVFALRRRLIVKLTHDERGTPVVGRRMG
jgi:hypothetical protein